MPPLGRDLVGIIPVRRRATNGAPADTVGLRPGRSPGINPGMTAVSRSKSLNVTLKLFGGLRQHRKPDAAPRRLPAGSTVGDLWADLEHDDPALVSKLREGIADGYLHVLVNGRNIVFLDGERTRLHDGDTVAVLPPIGGG